MITFETRSSKGVLRQEFYADINKQQVGDMLQQFVINEEWYVISYHNCFNDEGKPCSQWEVMSRKGTEPIGI